MNRLEIINLINTYNGTLLCILTFVYVVGTFLMVRAMNYTNENFLMPIINVFFYRDNKILFLAIENAGNFSGKSINVSFEPPLPTCESNDCNSKYLPFLAAKQRFFYPLGEFSEFYQTSPKRYNVSIKYSGIFYDKPYSLNYVIELNNVTFLLNDKATH